MIFSLTPRRIFIKAQHHLLKKFALFFIFSISFSVSDSFAALSSVDAFGQTVYQITRARCLNCHATKQSPHHADPDVQIAHDEVQKNSLVDFQTMTKSKLYLQLKNKHNCWSGNCESDALQMLNQIGNWKRLMSTPAPAPTTAPIGNAKPRAFRIYNRIAGTPPTSAALSELENLLKMGRGREAALKAMEDPNFYNVTLKNWIKPWSNVDRTTRVPLNDYVATVLGIIRDNIPFDQVLYGDYLYMANANTPGTIPAFSVKDNNHYQKLEDVKADLKESLMKVSQSATTGIADAAGVLTSRAAGAAFYSAGTNRRATRFTFINFMCRDFEALHDINISDYHVRQDVERNPGGDSRTYKNKCVGCHAGQDALGGAFAYFDFANDQLVYTKGVVAAKINKNVSFADGWKTQDDSWINTWAEGQNANLGWPSMNSGNGVQELGMMISRSRAFAECMSTRVYELVCLRTPSTSADLKQMRSLADSFQKDSEFNMKNLIADTALSCMGE